MPVNLSQFIPSAPGEAPKPPAVTPPPAENLPYDTVDAVLTTQRPYRFSGYELAHSANGDTLFFMKPSAWLTQPKIWSQRATSVGRFDLRAP